MENLMGEKPIEEYTPEELAEQFKRTKKFIDKQFIIIQQLYGKDQLDIAGDDLFIRGDTGSFSKRFCDVKKLDRLVKNHSYELTQVLIAHAISYYIADAVNNPFDFARALDNKIMDYAMDNPDLNYDPSYVPLIVALMTVQRDGIEIAMEALSINKKLKQALVRSFVTERYKNGKTRRDQLDAAKNTTEINVNGEYKGQMSIETLNSKIVEKIIECGGNLFNPTAQAPETQTPPTR